MNRNGLRSSGILVFVSILAASCGPDSLGNLGIDGTGIRSSRDVVSVGRIRSLGTIEVNGVHYDTAGATLTINGAATTPGALNVGDVVTVEGTIDPALPTAVARRVVAEHILQGKVEAIDVAATSLVALGQPVQLNGDTVYGVSMGNGLASLSVGDEISVSGFRNARGAVVATRVDRQTANLLKHQTTGAVTEVATDGRHFSINGLVVDYGTAVWLPADASDALKRGVVVQIKGAAPTSGTLIADSIEVKSDRLSASTERLAHVEGYITALDRTDNSQFKVGGLSVSTSSTTQFSGTVTIEAAVTVKGEVRPDGAVAASTVVPTIIPGGPPMPAGPYISVQGRVFDALSGPVGGASVDIFVQTANVGYSYTYVQRETLSGQTGQFTATVPIGALLSVYAHKTAYVQPCAVLVTAADGLDFDVELVATATLESINPPPPLSAVGATTVSGTIFEMVGGIRQPVAGAQLWFGDSMGFSYARTISDREGRYLACRMPNNPLWRWGTELWAQKEGYADAIIPAFDTSQSQVFDVEMKRR
jgi:hypothetical protein